MGDNCHWYLTIILLILGVHSQQWYMKNSPKLINEQQFKAVLEDRNSYKIIKYFTPQCRYCVYLKDVFDKLKGMRTWSIPIYDVNCEWYPMFCMNQVVTGSFPYVAIYNLEGVKDSQIRGFYPLPVIQKILEDLEVKKQGDLVVRERQRQKEKKGGLRKEGNDGKEEKKGEIKDQELQQNDVSKPQNVGQQALAQPVISTLTASKQNSQQTQHPQQPNTITVQTIPIENEWQPQPQPTATPVSHPNSQQLQHHQPQPQSQHHQPLSQHNQPQHHQPSLLHLAPKAHSSTSYLSYLFYMICIVTGCFYLIYIIRNKPTQTHRVTPTTHKSSLHTLPPQQSSTPQSTPLNEQAIIANLADEEL